MRTISRGELAKATWVRGRGRVKVSGVRVGRFEERPLVRVVYPARCTIGVPLRGYARPTQMVTRCAVSSARCVDHAPRASAVYPPSVPSAAVMRCSEERWGGEEREERCGDGSAGRGVT